MRIEDESVCALDMARKRLELLVVDFDDRSAFFADQMAVRRWRNVIGGGSMPKVDVSDNAKTFEFFEVSVDS